jgi:acyl-coenzyme A thioesterase PaaI-like protein
MNIMTSNPGFKPSVSLELNASYLKPALMNKQLFIASQILKTGKQTAVAEIKFYDEVKIIYIILCVALHQRIKKIFLFR